MVGGDKKSRMSGLAHISERRAYPRRQIAVTAFIEPGHGDYFVCQVINFGPNGACIGAKNLVLPNRFVLSLKLGCNMRRDCRVVWRDGYVAGLQFRLWPVVLH